MLVDDEIQMGFYRTGKLWGLQNFGITPDVVVFGKAMTNGLNPLAGIWAKERYINPQVFPCGSTHSTFASNPLGTAVASKPCGCWRKRTTKPACARWAPTSLRACAS